MTGLDKHNMTAIENSLKKAFRNIDSDLRLSNNQANSNNTVKSEVLGPTHFIKICVSLIWLMKV